MEAARPEVAITIRKAETFQDYSACQEAQRQAWGITSDGYVVPVATMVGAQLHGGLVLGAFLPSGAAVGLSFAFLGRSDERLCLYSQLTGVVPAYQSMGIGHRLKRVQWEFARAQGLSLLAWAFDPLQAGNAYFNLSKLGATAGRYITDMYGPRTDLLNIGLPTDRLIVEWETTDSAVRPVPVADWTQSSQILDTGLSNQAVPVVFGVRRDLESPVLLLEVPGDLQYLHDHEPDGMLAWRLALRAGFQHYFARGYRAVDFIRPVETDRRRCFYVLYKA